MDQIILTNPRDQLNLQKLSEVTLARQEYNLKQQLNVRKFCHKLPPQLDLQLSDKHLKTIKIF